MAIIGINFTGKPGDWDALQIERKVNHIPDTIAHMGQRLKLQGLCTSEKEGHMMVMQASNGRRRVVLRKVDTLSWTHAVYCS